MDTPDRMTRRTLQVAALLARPAGPAWRNDPNRPMFAQMIAGRLLNEGQLPADLGLGEKPFAALCLHYFPGGSITLPKPAKPFHKEAMPEWDDIRQLLISHRSSYSNSELW
ncbi:MAG: hypothetical protein RIR18_526, partial [Pseudomonadota bacterium]